ncbi:cytidylate kinase [Chromatiales bacterium (ex Bugula neritina AB1)]|nr:cytidylate kinase [Chromatiales bacterium (ex Bugula neritina AB1)]
MDEPGNTAVLDIDRSAVPVIAIDGPSGSGKGTIARAVAEKLGFNFLDSGALYRVVALASINTRTAADDSSGLALLASTAPIDFAHSDNGDVAVLLGGQDVTQQLRAEEVGNCASKIATHPELRDALLDRQRRWRQLPGLVADGRDMGTVVFPDALIKIFLTASAEIRAKRRVKQLKEKGISANISGLLSDIQARDKRDYNRAIAPLKAAADSIQIDSTSLSVAQVVTKVLDLASVRL